MASKTPHQFKVVNLPLLHTLRVSVTLTDAGPDNFWQQFIVLDAPALLTLAVTVSGEGAEVTEFMLSMSKHIKTLKTLQAIVSWSQPPSHMDAYRIRGSADPPLDVQSM